MCLNQRLDGIHWEFVHMGIDWGKWWKPTYSSMSTTCGYWELKISKHQILMKATNLISVLYVESCVEAS